MYLIRPAFGDRNISVRGIKKHHLQDWKNVLDQKGIVVDDSGNIQIKSQLNFEPITFRYMAELSAQQNAELIIGHHNDRTSLSGDGYNFLRRFKNLWQF